MESGLKKSSKIGQKNGRNFFVRYTAHSTYQRSFDIWRRPSFHSNEKGCEGMVFVLNINQVNAITIGHSIIFSSWFTAAVAVIIQTIQRGWTGDYFRLLVKPSYPYVNTTPSYGTPCTIWYMSFGSQCWSSRAMVIVNHVRVPYCPPFGKGLSMNFWR